MAYWAIVMLPFSIAIAPAPISVFIGFLIAGFIAKTLINKEKLFAANHCIYRPLIMMFIITCVSMFNSINYSDTLKGGIIRLLMYIFIFAAVSSQVKEKRHINAIIISICCGIALVSLDAVFQEITGRDFIRGYVPMISLDLKRATASFKDPNTFGIYLSAVLPLVLGLVLYYLKGIKRLIVLLVASAGAVAAVFTYSRPTLLAIYISLFILGLAKKNKALLAFLVILPLITLIFTPKSVKDWTRSVDYNPIRMMCNDDRIAAYRNTMNMIRANPILGVGANTFMKNYKRYKENPEYRNIVTADTLYAHNNFLHMAGEIGLAGLAAFLWFIFALFKKCIRIYRRLNDEFLKTVSLCLIASLAAFLVNGLTESSLYSSRVAAIFWFLAGLAVAMGNFTDAAGKPTN